MGIKLVLYILWLQGLAVLCVYSPEKQKEIRTETVLADTYDPLSRPTATTNVTVGVTLMSIDELSMPDQKFAGAGWITVEWEDPRLAWSPELKADIDVISAEPATLWKPELVIDNSIEELGVISDDNVLLQISHDGSVTWAPPMMYIVHCEIDVTYYPYDQQKCSIELTSWGFSNKELQLSHLFTGISLEDYRENGEWEVTKTDVSTSILTETKNGVTKAYSQLHFNLFVKRRDQFYNTNVMLPIILSSFLVTLVFVVPAESGEKLSYALTVLLTIAVFLTIIGETLPAISLTTSVLGLYLAATLIVSALATLMTVGILFIYHKKGEPQIGSRFYNVSRKARKLCCWKEISDEKDPNREKRKTEDGLQSGPDQEGTDQLFTWVKIAEVWDRLSFIVFVILTVLLNIIFILVLTIGGANSG